MIRSSHGVATSVGRVRRVKESTNLVVAPIYEAKDGTRIYGHGKDGYA
jgi:hypothetical protein